MSELTYEGFLKFVRDIARVTPDRDICHVTWERCTVGDYAMSVTGDRDDAYLFVDALAVANPVLHRALDHAGKNDRLQTYGDLRDYLDSIGA